VEDVFIVGGGPSGLFAAANLRATVSAPGSWIVSRSLTSRPGLR